MKLLKLIIFLLISQFSREIAAELISCEGFIKSAIPIDLSRIQTKLFTAQGNLKHETECNPQNGYFLIPIYNKGKYLVKVVAPEGWIFDPESHEIEITEEGGCSSELNFELFGFHVKGRVLNSGNVPITLGLYQDGGNKLVAKTDIDGDGKYTFTAQPGKYQISPTSGSAQCMDQGSVGVEVTNSPVRVEPDIRIAGQNLEIRVNDEKGKPLANAAVLLTSDKKIEYGKVPANSAMKLAISNIDGKWVFAQQADQTGSVQFHCLPNGKYKVTAQMERKNTEIEMLFEEAFIEMDSAAQKAVIGVKAFNYPGRVLSANTKPIAQVKILLDGIAIGNSGEDGTFELKGVSPGKHTVQGEKMHFQFGQETFEANSQAVAAIAITPKRLALCGSVHSVEKLDPLAFHIISREDGKALTKFTADKERKFCEMQPPGKYIVKPISSIPFAPKQFEIDLTEGPVLGLKFIQYKAKLEGKVHCFGECKNIGLELWQDGAIVSKLVAIANGAFAFNDILPGNYKLKVQDEQNIWWDAFEKEIEILDKDIHGIGFLQKGYRLEIRSSQPATFKYWTAKSKPTEVRLLEGTNFLQFKEANQFKFSILSCYDFGLDEPGEFKIPRTEPIILKAISSRVGVAVQTDVEDPSLRIVLSENASANEEIIEVQRVEKSKAARNFFFRLEHAKIGRHFQIKPSSDQLLFLPESNSFVFTGQCSEEPIAVFKTQIGQFIEGSVSPPVEGADVKAIGEGIVLTTRTEKTGKYKIGPVWDVQAFAVQLSKEGYEFNANQKNPRNFGAVKLSQLIIKFLDSLTKSPLPDVLVSISGGANFRSNNVTKDTGVLNFIGLAPGSYYIRPILQEYKFNSSSFTVQISEGQTEELSLEAKRYAYSVFGKVSMLGNKPLRVPVKVEAISKQCENHQEEDSLDHKSDEFRIRGLKPECMYRISLKDAEYRDMSAFPPIINLKTGMEDRRDVNFVLLPADRPDPAVVGELEFSGKQLHPNGFHVILSESGTILQEQHVQVASIFFFALPAYNKEYTISLDRIGEKQINDESYSVRFFADSPFNYVRLTPKSDQHSTDIEVIRSNYFGMALIMLITIAFMNQSKTKALSCCFLDLLQNFINNRRQAFANTTTEDPSKRRKIRR